MAEPALSLQHVSKAYWTYQRPADRLADAAARLIGRRVGAAFPALADVSFELAQGETIGLIGRNGAGKSTLLQVIAGTLQPSSGKVQVNGRLAAMIELGAGFNPEFTGRENISLGCALAGLSAKETRAKLPDILDFAGIGDFIDHPIKIYSSGMYARLAFAIAAHVDADILLIDEILSVGDVAFQRKCADFIARFKQRGAVVFTSHSLQSVQAMCSRAIWLDSGRVREDGDSETVCAHYLAETTAPVMTHDDAVEPLAPTVRSAVARGEAGDRIDFYPFDPSASWFGQGGGRIDDVAFLDVKGARLEHACHGDPVELRIECTALADIPRVLTGFRVCDELGQNVFGQNTHMTYEARPFSVAAGASFRARFQFDLPRLRAGLYSVVVALTEGTQTDNVHHHFITEALFVRVSQSGVFRGFAGIALTDASICWATQDASAES